MDHTNRPYVRLPPIHLDVSLVSGASDLYEISNDHYHSGRVVGRFIDYVGRHIDKSLVKNAERLGYGPRETKQKIRRRLNLIRHSFAHYEGRRLWSCEEQCKFDLSPTLIKEEVDKLEKDIKRLLKYVNSTVRWIQKQAIDCILDLSVDYDIIRALMKQWGAIGLIEGLAHIYLNFRTANEYIDNLLLSSSRKALLSLCESRLNTLLLEWKSARLPYKWEMGYAIIMKKKLALWSNIAPFLWDRDVAFLVMRVLNRSDWSYSRALRREVLRNIESCPVNLFESDECMDIMGSFCHIRRFGGTVGRNTAAKVLSGFGDTWSVFLKSDLSRRLNMRYTGKELFEFDNNLYVKTAVMHAIDAAGESSERLGHLQPFRGIFECPVERVVCKEVWDNWNKYNTSSWSKVCRVVAPFVDSSDPVVRDKAWEYANNLLNRGIKRCDGMLDALSGTAFAASVDFLAFKRKHRAKHIPIKEFWSTIYRHADENGRICLVDSCLCGGGKQEQLKYPNDFASSIRVDRGTAVSTADHRPLIVGQCCCVAETYVNLKCRCLQELYIAVIEGTKPEDLCVEVDCPHAKTLSVPEYLQVVTLSYPPNESPIVFVDGDDTLGDQVTLSWTPDGRHNKQRQQYSVRVTTVVEAVEIRVLSNALDEGWEREAAAICKGYWWRQLPICVEIARHVYSPDEKICNRARKYADYILARDLDFCDVMLEALSLTFVNVVDFTAFKMAKRANHIRSDGWEKVYRHGHEDGRFCLLEDCSCCAYKTEELAYHADWISKIEVYYSDSQAFAGRYPLIAGYGKDGAPVYVGQLVCFEERLCWTCRTRFSDVWFGTLENTKPEDLRIEVCCCQETYVFVPEKVEVLALRYPPGECPEEFYDETKGADATGPFSWKPIETHKCKRKSYTVRVVSKKDVIERGLRSDDETSPEDGWCDDDTDASSQEAMAEGISDDPGSTESPSLEQDVSEDELGSGNNWSDDGYDLSDQEAMNIDDGADDAESPSHELDGTASTLTYISDLPSVADSERRISDAESSRDDSRRNSPEDGDRLFGEQNSVQRGTDDGQHPSEGPRKMQVCEVGRSSNDASEMRDSVTSVHEAQSSMNDYIDARETDAESIHSEAQTSAEGEEAEAWGEPERFSATGTSSITAEQEAYVSPMDFRQAVIIVLSIGLGVVLTRAYDSMRV